jgi:hypothetical protein
MSAIVAGMKGLKEDAGRLVLAALGGRFDLTYKLGDNVIQRLNDSTNHD